jgi:hypothetical protein
MPGDRAMQFHRGSTLNSYLALFRSAMPARRAMRSFRSPLACRHS